MASTTVAWVLLRSISSPGSSGNSRKLQWCAPFQKCSKLRGFSFMTSNPAPTYAPVPIEWGSESTKALSYLPGGHSSIKREEWSHVLSEFSGHGNLRPFLSRTWTKTPNLHNQIHLFLVVHATNFVRLDPKNVNQIPIDSVFVVLVFCTQNTNWNCFSNPFRPGFGKAAISKHR